MYTLIWVSERSSQESNPSVPKKPFKKYDGPVYVPAEVYKLFSPEAVAFLKKYYTRAINKFPKKRDVTDITDHESTPSVDTIHEEQSEPPQFEDAPENEIDPILDYIHIQHHQEEDMNNAWEAYNAMVSPTQMIHPSSPSTWSIPTYSTMLHRPNKPNMVHLWIGVDLQGLMSGSSPSPPGSALSLALINTKSMVWTLCNVLHW